MKPEKIIIHIADATIYVGGLDEKVNESLMWELFVQAGPVVNVHMPKDRVSMLHQGYGFIEFLAEEDADYAIKIMNMIKLYGKPIRVNKASAHQKNLDVGANIFIGNLDPEVDEKLLYDTFSAFGVILTTPKVNIFVTVSVNGMGTRESYFSQIIHLKANLGNDVSDRAGDPRWDDVRG